MKIKISKTLKIIITMIVVIAAGRFIYTAGIFDSMFKQKSFNHPKVIGVIYQRQHQTAYDGMKEGMKKIGYTDKDIVYNEILITSGPTFSKDVENGVKKLIADNIDLLFVTSEQIDKMALEFTKNTNIPIVFMTRFHEPLSYGLIDSYRSSGNNSTGISTNLAETVQKNLFFFKEINPEIKKIGVFGGGFMLPDGGDAVLAELKKQGPKFGISIVEYQTKNSPDTTSKNWHEVADKINPGEIDGLYHLAHHFYGKQEVDESKLATRLQIPHSVPSSDIPTGGSFAFADDFHESAGQAAVMIDKILKGEKPSNIPIEFGSKSILTLQLKKASEAGFTFPNSMIFIADVKIK